MKILIGYATSEGQTRKIARFAADHLAARDHTVELLPLEDAEGLEIPRFDAVLLAGSVHAGGFQAALTDFARSHAAELAGVDDLFLAVSLTAAGEDAAGWAGLAAIVDRFAQETGWTPERVEHVAGAFRFTEYNLLERFIMRRIAAETDPAAAAADGDTEYTDWARLAETLDDWTAAIRRHDTDPAGDRT